ncbi:hypothetical protein SLS53_003995 [Cytospora paraplurivora]|uniref:Uncharacterized protein n=1 Tax=Cytospora paraplurivora TaxID=2898453 RepID=A0AAN9UAX1_9PEZI
MYTYPDYMNGTTQASSPMAIQTPPTHAPHDMLGGYLQHSPGHEDPLPPPQTNPYFGHYTASSVSVGQEPDGIPSYQTYLSNAINDNSYGLLERPSLPELNGNAYTHRPLAPSAHTPMAPIMEQTPPGTYRRDLLPISRLSPTGYARPSPVLVKRHPSRKPRARKSVVKKEQSTSPPLSQQSFGIEVSSRSDSDAPTEEVTLDDKTPEELRRLWDIRMKWQKKKGHGMWEDIVREFMGPEADSLSEDKKTQVKANLQMRVHRGVMKHGSWPENDKAALLRAYQRWEEMRYPEIHRLFLEEISLQGRQGPSYEWRTNNIEAELVKEGLEEKQRDTPSKARRRRVQVPARHVIRGGGNSGSGSFRPQQAPQQRLPPVFDPNGYAHHFPSEHQHHYGGQQQQQHYVHHHHQQQHRREMSAASSYSLIAEQLGNQPQALTDEQHERLIEECLERAPFEPSPDPEPIPVQVEDARMSDYPEEHLPRSRPQSSSLPAIGCMAVGSGGPPDINAQRSAAVARQACGEMMKQQQHQHQYASV